MSCEECERVQNLALNKNIPKSIPLAYFRIGEANVAIIGCQKHVLEMRDKLFGDSK